MIKVRKLKRLVHLLQLRLWDLTEVPEAGDIFYEVKDEKMAKHLIERRRRQEREQELADAK